MPTAETNRRRRARRNYTAREMEELHWQQMQAARAAAAPKKKKRRTAAQKKALAKARRAAQLKRVGRRYGPYKSVSARVGGRRMPTYAYRGPKGHPKKIPLWAIVGARSKSDLERRVADDPRLARRVVRAKSRREKASQRVLLHGDFFTPNRRRKTRRAVAVPYETWSENMAVRKNARKRGASFKRTAQYKKMMAGLRRYRRAHGKSAAAPRKTRGRRHRTAAQRRATAHMLAARWGKRVRARKTWKNAEENRRRRRRRNVTSATPNRRSVANRRRRRRKNPMYSDNRRVANRRRRRNAAPVTENRRRRTRRRRKNPMYADNRRVANRRRRRRHYEDNRRVHRRRRRHVANVRHYAANRPRRYRRNPGYADQLKSVFKIGATVTLGFVGHRALSHLVSESLLGSMATFQTGSGKDWRGVIGGLITALAGIPLANKMLEKSPSTAAQVGAGIVASLLHQTLITVLKVANQPDVAGYLAAYPNEDGRPYHTMAGYGAYEMLPPGAHGVGAYELYPGYQGTHGFGEYVANPWRTSAAAGFGAYDYYDQYHGMGQPITQAAAAFGQGPRIIQPMHGFGQPITQAAAAYGQPPNIVYPPGVHGYDGFGQPITQAAAAFGAVTPDITQAAAGTGEFIATGLKGIGQYDGVDGYGLGAPVHTDEGVHPDLTSAERALSVAEAAAGVGDLPPMASAGRGDVPLISTLIPDMIAAPIEDAPTGARAGILYGGDGIFS